MSAIKGFVGVNWNIRSIPNIGLSGLNWVSKSYLIVRVINIDTVSNLDVRINTISGEIVTTTNEDGYAFVAERDFAKATVTVSKDGVPVSKEFDITVQTNQYLEINIAVFPILRFPKANPIRVVITDFPVVAEGVNDQTFHADQPSPFFDSDRYYQKLLKGAYTHQIVSNFGAFNTAKIFNLADEQQGDDIEGVMVVDSQATLGFNRYEFAFNFGTLSDGEYYIQFEGLDQSTGQDLEYTAKSEPFSIRASHLGTVALEYYTTGEGFDVDYSTGIKHTLIFEAAFWRTKEAGDKTVFINDKYDSKKLSAVKRTHGLLDIHGVPHYLLDKINLALDHDTAIINGQEVSTTEDIEPEIEEDLSLVKGEAWLPFKVAFVNRN